MQRATVVLRYGVGPVRARSERQAARLLDLSRGGVRRLERRGMRNLARSGRGTSCEQTGISTASLVAVYNLLRGGSTAESEGLPAPLAAGVRLADAASVLLDEGEGAVAGVRDSDEERRHTPAEPEEEQEEEGSASSAGPSLGDPFGSADTALDNPMFLLLVAIVVACLASAAREIRRAVR